MSRWGKPRAGADPQAMKALAEKGEARRRAHGATPEAIAAAMAAAQAEWDARSRLSRRLHWWRLLAASWLPRRHGP